MLADCFIRSRPTAVETVNETFFTFSWLVRTSPTSGVFTRVITKFITSLGILAHKASSTKAKAVNGVSLGDFNITVQPVASVGATLRVIIAVGKFYGVIKVHILTDFFMVRTLFVPPLGRIVLLYIWGASSVNHNKKLVAYATSPRASTISLLFSYVIKVTRSWAFSRINWCQLRK